jgi:hypothetical protein
MPLKDFKWVDEKEFEKLDFSSMTDEQKTGYILEVDLEYPKHLHKSHCSFPLAPQHLKIDESMLSPYARKCHKLLTGKRKYSSKKLCATLAGRKNYGVHYMNLKLYLTLGLQVKKIHRVLSFTQSTFLKKYIDKCTKLRQLSKTDFGKRQWKLFANAVFGKFIEGTRNFLNVKLCKNIEQCARYISNPNFSSIKIISEDLVAVFLKHPVVQLNKAYPIGFTILERSKEFMFHQFYNVIRPKLPGCRVWVLMSDTDSFCLAIESWGKPPNVFKILRDIFDFSNYPPSSDMYTIKNASKLGYWKDELQGGKMIGFVGLRSKTYAFKRRDHEKKELPFSSKCKGVSKSYRKTIPYETFKQCITEICQQSISQVSIRAKSHVVQTLKSQKICFSSFDDKRYLMECGIHSVPYGSRLIETSKRLNGCYYCIRDKTD